MHGDGAGPPIPLKMNVRKEMQLAKVAHLELTLEASLQLVDHVHDAYQNDGVAYIHDDNYNVMENLQNV